MFEFYHGHKFQYSYDFQIKEKMDSLFKFENTNMPEFVRYVDKFLRDVDIEIVEKKKDI